jgi:hypothetical protein
MENGLNPYYEQMFNIAISATLLHKAHKKALNELTKEKIKELKKEKIEIKKNGKQICKRTANSSRR